VKRFAARIATDLRRELREERRRELQDCQDRMSSPVDLTDDELAMRALRAHARYCLRSGFRPNQPGEIQVDGRRITLKNVNGVLGVYRFAGRRIQRVGWIRCEGLRRVSRTDAPEVRK
jgi:hypothetical protein